VPSAIFALEAKSYENGEKARESGAHQDGHHASARRTILVHTTDSIMKDDAMFDAKSLDEIARKLAANLPPGLREFQQEVEKNLRATLQAMFSRMDLITREEFDAQAKVLARTRAQLETLEARIAALEAAYEKAADDQGSAKPV